MNSPLELDAAANNSDFLLRRIILNIESDRIVAALAEAASYAEQEQDAHAETFKAYLLDLPLMRRIAALDAIKSNPETAFEYFDKDMDNDPYVYDEVTERKITAIKIELIQYVGRKIKAEDVLAQLMERL